MNSLAGRPAIRATVLALLVVGLAFAWQPGGQAATAGAPGGWTGSLAVGNIPQPMDFAFAPDGRIFVASLTGEVRIIQPNGQLLSTPFYTVFENSVGERGLVGLTLDPNFASNGYVYLYYTHETNVFDPQGVKNNRLVRVTANGNTAVPGSEKILLGSVIGTGPAPSCLSYPAGTDCLPADGLSHVGGGLRFAPDGSLFVATGDASFLAPNPDLMMTKAQDLDWLGGKVLRIDPATGYGVPSNPFYTGDPTVNRSKVYAYGLRQPFRFSVRPGTNTPYLGDVGSSEWEEIDVIAAGGNYGWPCFEGYVQHPAQSDLPFCQAFYASQPVVQHPVYAYARMSTYGAAVIGGVFANGTNYPPDASGAYFFADYVRDEIYTLRFSANNDPIDGSFKTIVSGGGHPVGFEVGPDGDVYYMAWDRSAGSFGELRHLTYVAGNRAPEAHASATPPGGLTPLPVTFSSAGTTDPDGDNLSYNWTFGDGGSSTAANPSHTYTQNGLKIATLTVSDGNGGQSQATLQVLVGNQPPVATIRSPYDMSPYDPWDVVAYAGSGYDPETGTLPTSALHWSIGLRHCEPVVGGVCHTHPFLEKTGSGGTFAAPDQGGELNFMVIELTATDAVGLSHTVTVIVGEDADDDGLLDRNEALTYGSSRFLADTDGGGLRDGADALLGDPQDPGDDAALGVADADGDGCSNAREAGPNAMLGGRRNVLNRWDFYDVWTRNPGDPNTWGRDGSIDLFGDILGVAMRFGTARSAPPSEPEALAEAAVPPVDETSYHVAFDRGMQVGPEPWSVAPPDGEIDLFNDIIGAAYQFGHDCTAAP